MQQTIQPGGSALFQCRVTGGIPAPTVTWTRYVRVAAGMPWNKKKKNNHTSPQVTVKNNLLQ
jgi:hypothetical protein